nr:hypothetical protein [uncultured Draconibacterium sp.]
MENEEKIKQAWQTPEIIDLDADATAGKIAHTLEMSAFGPS